MDEHKRLVILGAPGAGKSTLLRYLARRAAENGQGSVPILISLREFAAAYTTNPTLTLVEYALQKQAAGSTQLREALQMANEQGNIFWLLDGLDEARTLADDISRQMYQLQGQWVLTSRPVGYTGAGLPNVSPYEVLPLTPEKVDQFLADWLALLAEEESQPEQLAVRVAALKVQLGERPQLQALTRNPLLLTFMAVLASRPHTQTLPHKRADLYALYLEQLRDWEIARLKAANPQSDFSLGDLKGDEAKKVVLEGLYYLGWALFLNYYGGRADQVPSPDYLKAQMAAYLTQDGFGEAEAVAKGVWEFWRTAGMLDTWELEGHTYLAFRHFTFLEYAAAWGLHRAWERNERGTWRFLKPRLHHPAWREPILLWGGGLPAEGINKVLRRLRWGVSSDENILHRDLLLAAALLVENDKADPKIAERIVRKLAWLGRSHIRAQKLVLFMTRGILLSLLLILFVMILDLWWGLGLFVLMLSLFIVVNTNNYVNGIFNGWINSLLLSLQFHSLVSTPFEPVYKWLETLHSTTPTTFHVLLALQDENDWIRQLAINTLGKIGDTTSVPHLINTLQDENHHIRMNAAQALGQIGDITSVPHLIATLYDDDDEVYWETIQALGQMGERAVPYLIDALHLPSGDSGLHQGIAIALAKIGTITIPTLIATLHHKEWEARRAVIETLGLIGDATIVPHLLSMLHDESNLVRQEAIESLGQIGDATAVPYLITSLQDKNILIRHEAIKALEKIGKIAVPYLIVALQDKDSAVCQIAIQILGQIGETVAVPHLITVLQDSEVRSQAIQALGDIGDSEALPYLLEALHDDEKWVRQIAIKALGKIDNVIISMPYLIAMLQDENHEVRQATVETLGKIYNNNAMPYLIAMLQDENHGVRQATIETFGKINDKMAIPYLTEMLEDENEWVRQAAIRGLGEIGDATTVPYLIAILQDKDQNIRKLAIQALGKIGTPVTIPHLISALRDTKWWVRLAATEALWKIGEVAVPPLIIALQDKRSWVRQGAIYVLSKIGKPTIWPYFIISLQDEDTLVRMRATKALESIVININERKVLQKIRNILWSLRLEPVFSRPVYNQTVQRLTELTVRELPINDPLRPSPRYTPPPWLKWGGGVVAAAVAHVLTTTALNILSTQLGSYLPTNSVAVVVAVAVGLVFLVAFSRWLEK
ncbi:MAG: HEAT repeat domain-containing protein [Chloroflexi bacterium]|nr:HEAT repeat domain-containing protein [Chloroflexota bacterium]